MGDFSIIENIFPAQEQAGSYPILHGSECDSITTLKTMLVSCRGNREAHVTLEVQEMAASHISNAGSQDCVHHIWKKADSPIDR